MLPEEAGVIISSAKKGRGKRGEHIVSAARGTGGRARGGRTEGEKIFVKGGGRSQRGLVRQEGRVGRERALKTVPKDA